MSRHWTEDDVALRSRRAADCCDMACAQAVRSLLDRDAEKRIEARECRYCFYHTGGRLSGQAFTAWTCAVCGKEQPPWPNTGHPLVCTKCAKEHTLCVRCGGDFHMRTKRLKAEKLEEDDDANT